MSLRHALLALLTAGPLTAYDISKQFSASVGFVWYAPDSQIYPALRRMEADGLVEATELPLHGGGTRVKRLYRPQNPGAPGLDSRKLPAANRILVPPPPGN